MKVFLERTISQEAVQEVSCNLCGCQVGKNDFGYFEDHLSVSKTWGYGTVADGETHTFDLCFECYSDFKDSFVIPARVLDGATTFTAEEQEVCAAR